MQRMAVGPTLPPPYWARWTRPALTEFSARPAAVVELAEKLSKQVLTSHAKVLLYRPQDAAERAHT